MKLQWITITKYLFGVGWILAGDHLYLLGPSLDICCSLNPSDEILDHHFKNMMQLFGDISKQKFFLTWNYITINLSLLSFFFAIFYHCLRGLKPFPCLQNLKWSWKMKCVKSMLATLQIHTSFGITSLLWQCAICSL